MYTNKARKAAIAERRAKVARRYMQGHSQGEIAKALGVCQATVCYDLEAIRCEWMEASVRDFDQAKADELAKIDHLESEYWSAWERSKLHKETLVNEVSKDDRKRRKTKEGQTGNATYLAGVQWCITKRCELLGLLVNVEREDVTQDRAKKIAAQVNAMRNALLLPAPGGDGASLDVKGHLASNGNGHKTNGHNGNGKH